MKSSQTEAVDGELYRAELLSLIEEIEQERRAYDSDGDLVHTAHEAGRKRGVGLAFEIYCRIAEGSHDAE